MSDYHKFQTVDKKFTLCVKNNFLEKCSNPETMSSFDLNNKHYLFKFLHNPAGPAVIRHKDNRKSYWVDGVCLDKEDPARAKKIEFDSNFSAKLDDIVNE